MSCPHPGALQRWELLRWEPLCASSVTGLGAQCWNVPRHRPATWVLPPPPPSTDGQWESTHDKPPQHRCPISVCHTCGLGLQWSPVFGLIAAGEHRGTCSAGGDAKVSSVRASYQQKGSEGKMSHFFIDCFWRRVQVSEVTFGTRGRTHTSEASIMQRKMHGSKK